MLCRLLLPLAVLLALPSTALAHPLVEEGRSRFEEADFQGALRALRGAERADDLTREDVIRLLETRALVYRALQDEARLEAALRALGTVDSDHAFSPEVPPEVSERFTHLKERLPGALRLEVDVRPIPGGLAVEAAAHNDVEGLVRHVRVYARPEDGRWQSAEDQRLTVLASPGSRVIWYAQAIGPGGAVLASRGTETAPETAVVPKAGRADVPSLPADGAPVPAEEDGPPWLWIGVGAGAAAVAAGVLAFFLLRDTKVTTTVTIVDGTN